MLTGAVLAGQAAFTRWRPDGKIAIIDHHNDDEDSGRYIVETIWDPRKSAKR